MDPSSWISKLTDRGDLGIALISYVIGYALDFWLFPGGMTSGVVAGLSAAGSVGLKNVSQWIIEPSNPQIDADVQIRERYSRLADYIDEFLKTVTVEKDDPMKSLQRELAEREFLWRSGITSDRDFNHYLDRVRSKCEASTERYLRHRLHGRDFAT